MRVAIITIAGISSRFNEGVPEEKKVLKAIYSTDNVHNTLLYNLMKKVLYADRIILVGGYKFNELATFVEDEIRTEFPQTILIKNDHFDDLGSGYSLYLGAGEALRSGADEVLFVEGDLDIDDESFRTVVDSKKSVLTFTSVPIYANKAVVLFRDAKGRYKYAFNSDHGLLKIDEPFSCIFNSGQTWKFTNAGILREACDQFIEHEKDGTNLGIVRRYIDQIGTNELELIFLKRWVNCNTRDDYNRIRKCWEV